MQMNARSMKLKKLSITSFRNISTAEITAGERFNILFGKNAQGKTNLLESIFLLGTMKSFRTAKNRDMIKWGEPHALIRGLVTQEKLSREIHLLVTEEGKKARIDNKAATRLTDYFGNLNSVVFSPDEMTMIKGEPGQRRRYLDRAIFSADLQYLQIHHEYQSVLRNRNALLKSGDQSSIDIWNDQLVSTGFRLLEKRLSHIKQIEPLVQKFHQAVAGFSESVTIRYLPHQMELTRLLDKGPEELREALARNRREEERRGTTMVGPHRDDMEFLLEGRRLKQFASQGQQRSFILALKMAEIEYLQQQYNTPPVLLLDDMTSELDEQRNRNLLDFLEQKRMQVFITTTSLDNLHLASLSNYHAFHIEGGRILQ